ncbi:MAG TPA: site-specific integrase, partial [Verrucomicrobiae bacterium]|nr:site-specific integrase [Verrucomicrobiae bacterium]
SIFHKQGTRFWQVSYYDGNGQQVQESSKSEKKSVAEALLRDRLLKAEQGLPVAEMKSWKYEDAREAFIRDSKVKGNRGLKKYKRRDGEPWALMHLDKFFKGRLMKTITTDTIHDFIEDRLDAGKANGTVNRIVAALSRMLHIGVRDGKLARVPHIPKLDESAAVRTGFVEDPEFKKIRKALPKKLHPLMLFLYTTGCRVGAAKAIRWNQIEERAGKMYVRLPEVQVKNKEPLLLRLTNELAALLRKLPRSGPVFDATNLRRAWDAAIIEIALPDLLVHDLRRSGARNLVAAGVPESVVMQIGGWKTASVFRRYNIVSTKDLDRAMDALEGK